jgi:2-polyprenyl-6-methoxyphenol hydroxylase-like FAD-dependent oxidoreductase
VTTHQYHARDVVMALDLSTVDGIATVGGDGLFSEVRLRVSVRRATHSSPWPWHVRVDATPPCGAADVTWHLYIGTSTLALLSRRWCTA